MLHIDFLRLQCMRKQVYHHRMIFDDTFTSFRPEPQQTFLCFGFTSGTEGKTLRYMTHLAQYGMDIEFTLDIDCRTLRAQAYDAEGELYALLNVPDGGGSFAGGLREAVMGIYEKILAACFTSTSCRQQVLDFALKTYGTRPVFPWEGDASSATLNCENGKWYGLLMTIPLGKLTPDSSGSGDCDAGTLSGKSGRNVDVLNIKLPPKTIQAITDGKTVFPAYHMNKKYWVTVLLTEAADISTVTALLEMSHDLVSGASRKAVGASRKAVGASRSAAGTQEKHL